MKDKGPGKQEEGRERDKEEKYTPADMHRASLASFWALFPSLHARKELSALIQTSPSFSPPGSWSGLLPTRRVGTLNGFALKLGCIKGLSCKFVISILLNVL